LAHGTGRQSGGFWGKRKQKNETAFRTDEFEHARRRSAQSIAITFAGSTQNLTMEKRDPRGEISESRRGIDACQVARRSAWQILRYARGKQSHFFVFFSPKNPLSVCLCRVPKIGGL